MYIFSFWLSCFLSSFTHLWLLPIILFLFLVYCYFQFYYCILYSAINSLHCNFFLVRDSVFSLLQDMPQYFWYIKIPFLFSDPSPLAPQYVIYFLVSLGWNSMLDRQILLVLTFHSNLSFGCLQRTWFQILTRSSMLFYLMDICLAIIFGSSGHILQFLRF